METIAQLQNTADAAAIAREVNGFRTGAAARRTAVRTAPSRRSNIGLWIVQAALAALFLFAGVSKLVMPADQLTSDTDLSAEFLRFIGLCETLGAIGLILPWALNIRSRLTPLAAAGLVIIMGGATVITAATGDVATAIVPAVIGLLCYLVAWSRRLGRLTTATN